MMDEGERHARMRSVGVVMRSFLVLRLHLGALRAAAAGLNATPGDYSALLELFGAHSSPSRNPSLPVTQGLVDGVGECGGDLTVLFLFLPQIQFQFQFV